jgi:hypothetical protein
MTHRPYPHLIELGYSERANLIGRDAPRAKLHVEKCPCGADTVRPYTDELIACMAAEWGVHGPVDERVRARILAQTYDPAERDDLASGEVWAGARALA